MTQRYALALLGLILFATTARAQPVLFPAPGAVDVNPDTRLRLTFAGLATPTLGNRGRIKIIDAADDKVVDELDLSIPPGPRNNRSPAPYDTLHYDSIPDTVFTVSMPDTDASHVYQSNYVGGTEDSDARRFFPVLFEQNIATVTPHSHRLSYGKTYYVQIDAEVFPLADGSFAGIADKTTWRFTTKAAAPAADAAVWVVSPDNSADFSSIQGAIDAVPSNAAVAKELFIKRGNYDEMISIRNKQNLTLRGEDRQGVLVRYANNGVFNPKGRYAFAISSSSAVNLINFTIQSLGKDENPAQAEALYVRGDRLQVHYVTMLGSGDALQIQASSRLFVSHSSVRGYGDNLLSYGAAFFRSSDLISTYGPHGWPRNPQTNHGDVFVDSSFSLEGVGTSGDGHNTLARSPASNPTSGMTFPYAEFVLLNCKLAGIGPEGWGAAGPDYANVHFWEYNSVDASSGQPVDVSQRVSYSRQLTMEKDAETIANYSDPGFVLGGWTPELAPVILTQPAESVTLPSAGSTELSVSVAAEPVATYQWLKNDQALPGETGASLTLGASTPDVAAAYTLKAQNSLGMTLSRTISVTVEGAPAPSGGSSGATGTLPPAAGQAGANATAPQAAADNAAQSSPAASANAPSHPAAISGNPTASSSAAAPGQSSAAVAGQSPQHASQSGGGCSLSHAGAEGQPGSTLLVGLALVFLRVRCRVRRGFGRAVAGVRASSPSAAAARICKPFGIQALDVRYRCRQWRQKVGLKSI